MKIQLKVKKLKHGWKFETDLTGFVNLSGLMSAKNGGRFIAIVRQTAQQRCKFENKISIL
jgi:hypothetical protein